MRSILRHRKALSPVVAAIILIAVTVAVSIAVAAWMGALTFTFMDTEELKILNVRFEGNVSRTMNVTLQNTGTTHLVVNQLKVGNQTETIEEVDGTFSAGTKGSIKIDFEWKAGTTYEVELLTTKGNKFIYRATAPQ